MKRFLSLLGLLIVAIVGTFLLFPYLLSVETIREAVAEEIESATGRDVAFSGPASLSLFPSLNVRVAGATLANAPGMGPEPLVAMDGLTASLQLLPLLTGQIRFDRLILIRPRFTLALDEAGQANWHLGGGKNRTAPASAAPAGRSDAAGIRKIGIGEFLVRDGQISYTDRRSGMSQVASSINATINWPAPSGPMNAAGSLVWRGEVINFKASCTDAPALATGGRSEAAVTLDTNRGSLELSGVFSTAVDFAVDGRVSLRTPSLRALARWFELELPVAGGMNELTIRSKFIAGGPKLSFSDATLSLDGNDAEGAVIVKLGAPRPQVQATLALSTLDLNPYLGQAAPVRAQDPAARPAAGWSTREIEFSGLSAIDADVRLSANRIVARDLPLGGGALTVALKDGMLTAQAAQLKAYEGEIGATLAIDRSRSTPLISLNATAQKVQMQPLLRDLAGFARLKGTGSLSLNLSSAGSSERALVERLSGTVQLAAANGALTGVDIGAMAGALSKGSLEGWNIQASRQTPFERLQASYYVRDGVARNDDFALEGKALTVAGSGMVDLPARMLDYRVTATLIASQATAGEAGKPVMRLPVIVRGAWSDPLIYPDPAGLIEAVPGAREAIEQAGDRLRKGDLKGAAEAIRKNGLDGLIDSLTGRKAD